MIYCCQSVFFSVCNLLVYNDAWIGIEVVSQRLRTVFGIDDIQYWGCCICLNNMYTYKRWNDLQIASEFALFPKRLMMSIRLGLARLIPVVRPVSPVRGSKIS